MLKRLLRRRPKWVIEGKKNMQKARKTRRDAIKKGDIRDKALYLIEHYCTPLGFDCLDAREMSKEDLVKAVDRIYTYTHGACTLHMCYHVHDDFRKEIEDDYKKLIKHHGG